jgi:hypothetical protein
VIASFGVTLPRVFLSRWFQKSACAADDVHTMTTS